MVSVVAPAGYGKTTLLADWARQDRRPSAWITLDERHNDPALLLSSIGSALHAIEPLADQGLAPLATPRSAVSSVVVPRLREALGSRSEPFVLVLDDLHTVHRPEAIEPLAAIAPSVPPGSQLAVAARSEPPLPLGRMRADHLLVEVRARELAMTRAEASRMLEACGLSLSSESVGRLVERTEGWPVGLYLAALSLADKHDVDAAIEDFHGDDRLVADYLREEFLSALDREDLEFLTRTSILDRLSGELCDTVLRRQGSAQVLRRLSRSNLMIVPLDGRDHSFRHHVLLREMLRSELHRVGAEPESVLHARASAWLRDSGDADGAVAHAIKTGDLDLAAKLIWANAADYEGSGRHATLEAWLTSFSEAQVASSPPLCLAQATAHLTGGNGAGIERWTGIALDRLSRLDRSEDDEMVVAARVIQASGAARHGIGAMREDLEAAYPLLSMESAFRSVCRLVEGAAMHLGRDRTSARAALEDGIRFGGVSAPSVQSISRAQLALLCLDEDDPGEGERQIALALAETEHYGLADYPTQAIIFAVAALIGARRGRSEAAQGHARTAVRLLSGLNEFSPWYEAEVRITLARALILLDDVVAARAHLADSARYARQVPDAVVMEEWLEDAWAAVESASSVGGRWPLTPAELRLLHVLPTHFSFREIADQVYVSPNTVKTQAQSIYRKLGVSSRAEAVACAKAAGLLRPSEAP